MKKVIFILIDNAGSTVNFNNLKNYDIALRINDSFTIVHFYKAQDSIKGGVIIVKQFKNKMHYNYMRGRELY